MTAEVKLSTIPKYPDNLWNNANCKKMDKVIKEFGKIKDGKYWK